MSTQMKITYAWILAGIVFGVVGLLGILGGNMNSFITLAMAGLILWTTGHNAGGWDTIKWDLKKRLRLFGKN